jgi:hypothetical protein
MYPGATNYDPNAEEEDGSCIIPGCTNPDATNYDKYANTDNGTCIIPGCMNPLSINYNAAATVDNGSCQLAGSGGNTTIVAKPQHHGVPIFNQLNYFDTAYVKFSTQNFPGPDPAFYDTLFAGASGEDHVTIPGMKTGYYYIWMAGFDTTIALRVTGGLPLKLTQASGQVNIIIPVTE